MIGRLGVTRSRSLNFVHFFRFSYFFQTAVYPKPLCLLVHSHAFFESEKPVDLKNELVFDKKTKVIIGGQIVSHGIAPAREIDAVSAFILGKKTIEDLTTFTSACNPDISSEPSAESTPGVTPVPQLRSQHSEEDIPNTTSFSHKSVSPPPPLPPRVESVYQSSQPNTSSVDWLPNDSTDTSDQLSPLSYEEDQFSN